MNKDFANFMESRDNDINENIVEINPKEISIYNIRTNDSGLYFNMKIINNDEQKVANNLFIPSRFYYKINTISPKIEPTHNLKNKLIAYFLIYPAAIFSLAIIFATLFKYLPSIEKFLNFSSLY